ncbi:MAG: diaminopimelate epimerase [Bacteroidota bacterium]
MLLKFHKYQGTGNDFILIDNRTLFFPKNDTNLVSFLCDRKYGIGADGLILLENDMGSDFSMVYYNSDGNESSMCGNGGRCIVAFANELGMVDKKTSFNAIDGQHAATIGSGSVKLQMKNVLEIREKSDYYFLNTGSPHHVQMVENLEEMDVRSEGEKLRYGLYGQKGSNINFVKQVNAETFAVRTYERGVENETLSCGTGVTAVALAMDYAKKTISNTIYVITKGGQLQVSFEKNNNGYQNITLTGPTQLVFKGEIQC